MSTSLSIPCRRAAALTAACDFIELTKPRIALLVLLVVAASGIAATWTLGGKWALLHAIAGTCLVAASASAANQWLECDRDARMARTSNRPLPAGRLSSRQTLAFILLTLVAGLAWLVLLVGWPAATWGMVTWCLYVLVYTPLKTCWTSNTAVGAIAGALPVFIGWSAVGSEIDFRAMALFLILFLWQFPHFMAIAWLYRHDYARGGYQMLPVIDPTGRRAGVQSVLAAAALIPVAALPVLNAPNRAAALYLVGVTALGLVQLGVAFWFLAATSDRSARWLLRMSLVYMPVLLVLLIAIPLADGFSRSDECRRPNVETVTNVAARGRDGPLVIYGSAASSSIGFRRSSLPLTPDS
jgi:protoheme IX farnesyltransferase